ncbi:uncharacterized protein LOC107607523 [Arachis ipaensis]|uniref:uncharacterized protein LOC107607523 n=1 Tax=Arachis ipaensis TaxID=130454 RepID=UPI0007AF891C|nr:uncharacterized protein LOC107607523 [Arachis ipaensis]
MKFNTKWEFKEAVREFTIQEGRRMRFRKNDGKRVRAVWKVKDYKWVVYASRDHEDSCWNCEATTYFKTKYDLSLNRNSISRALCDARNIVYGEAKEQYAMLRDYGETLLKTNPGSTVQICTKPQPNGEVIFKRMYVCLSGCKSGFRAGCRPLLGLDGAFLKTIFGGQILSAVGQDANHHIYVIAWAVVEVENFENWKWFLELLHEDLGDYKTHGWNFISDMQKYIKRSKLLDYYGERVSKIGTIIVIDEERITACHESGDAWCRPPFLCLALVVKFQQAVEGPGAEGTVMGDYMDRIKRLNADAWRYLDKWPREAWTRSQFRHNPKLDSICNNSCEVFNSKIKEARGKPILTLLEEVRMFVMRTMAKNKVKLDNHLGLLPPVIKSRLEKVRKESRHWHAIWSGDTGYEKFEVHGRPTNHVVDLGKILWIPCVHACAALAIVNKHPEDFCHKFITMESYKETYKPLAPPIKRKPGNLQTKRRKDSDEGTSSSKKSKPGTAMKRQLRPFTCKYCLQKDHTKRGCKKKRAADAAQATADATAVAKAAEAAKDPKNATA